MDEATIQRQAKKILDEFASSLGKITLAEKRIKRDVGGFREEGAGKSADERFRRAMFANAPKTEGDFLISEKKKWQ